MGWLIALGIIALLAALPLGVSASYDSDGAVVRAIIGPLKITLYPRPKKAKKPQKKNEEKTPEAAEPAPEEPVQQAPEPSDAAQQPQPEQPVQEPAKEEQPKKQSGGPITDFLPLVQIALEMLGAFRRRLRVNVLNLKLIMASDDPCDLAVNYGRAWAAVGNLLPQLEKVFVIKKRNIEVECDFCATQTLVVARLDLTITLGRLLATVMVYGVRAVMEFLKINKKRKGGAAK